jgi:hypothetical protein
VSQKAETPLVAASFAFTSSFIIKTHSLPTLFRCYPLCSFTFYVAHPILSILPSAFQYGGQRLAGAIG